MRGAAARVSSPQLQDGGPPRGKGWAARPPPPTTNPTPRVLGGFEMRSHGGGLYAAAYS